MSKVKDFIGKEAIHDDLGRVFVDGAPKGSKAMVDITCIQRGPGWDDATQEYKRYKLTTGYDPKTGDRSLRWKVTNNDEYGFKDRVHIKTLKLAS